MTFHHVQGLAGLADPKPRNQFSFIGMLAYVGGQAGLLLIFLFGAWGAALVAYPPGKEQDPGIRYPWGMSAPMFAVFLGFSVKTGGGEVNWPVTAYLAGMVLAAAWLERQLQSPRAWYRRLTTVNLGFTCVVGLGLTLTMHHSVWLYPLL